VAKHTVRVKLPKHVEIDGKDLEVQVKSNGRTIGTLKISKGSLDWRDAYDQKSHIVPWQKFAEFAKDQKKKHKR